MRSSISSSSLCLNDQNVSTMIVDFNNNDDDELNRLLNEIISSNTTTTAPKNYLSCLTISSSSNQKM